MEQQELTLTWRGIAMQITYKQRYADTIAHLEVNTQNKQRLPITETGYRSHFTHAAEIEAYDSPIEYVQAWLEEAAKSKAWKRYETDKDQLKLF